MGSLARYATCSRESAQAADALEDRAEVFDRITILGEVHTFLQHDPHSRHQSREEKAEKNCTVRGPSGCSQFSERLTSPLTGLWNVS